MLLCSVALLCSPLECGKHKKVKKEENTTGLYKKQIKCSADMTVQDFKNVIARTLNVDPAQIAIIVNEQDIAFKSETTLQELRITKESMPSVVIQSGIRKPKAKKQVKKEALSASVVAVKTEEQKDIDAFLNN